MGKDARISAEKWLEVGEGGFEPVRWTGGAPHGTRKTKGAYGLWGQGRCP